MNTDQTLVGKTTVTEAIIGGVGVYQADLIVDDQVIVELKVARALDTAHRAQCLNYLRAAGLSLGLVINFGLPRIDVDRVQAFH